jgi:uncharacterized protein DUF6328
VTPSADSPPPGPGPDLREGRPDTRGLLDRQLIELLNELRIVLPGVQVLFAFLLTVPFTARFGRLTSFQRDVYFATLMATALATVLLIAPSAFHRIRFHKRDRPHLIEMANRLAIGGIALLALAMTGAVLLISDLIFGALAAAVVTVVTGLVFFAFWFGVPLRRAMILDAARDREGQEDG